MEDLFNVELDNDLIRMCAILVMSGSLSRISVVNSGTARNFI